jgi:hypothetical protein
MGDADAKESCSSGEAGRETLTLRVFVTVGDDLQIWEMRLSDISTEQCEHALKCASESFAWMMRESVTSES